MSQIPLSGSQTMRSPESGTNCLIWTLASLGPLRLTPRCCTHRNLATAAQMLATQVSCGKCLQLPSHNAGQLMLLPDYAIQLCIAFVV